MAIRNIREYGDEVLTKTCKEVKEMTPRTKELIEDMLETMYDANGVGLAAPQVGVLKRIVVIDTTGEDPYILINPRIVESSGEQTGQEGCLSVPGKFGIVTRPNYVKAVALDVNMKPIEVEGTELLARAICQEPEVIVLDEPTSFLDIRYKLELLMNQADLTVGQREVEKQAHARSESTGGAPAAAIELPDGTVVTGKTGPLLGAAASALMNALKVLAGIPQETDLVSAASIEPIQTLKTNYLGSKNPRLHTCLLYTSPSPRDCS